MQYNKKKLYEFHCQVSSPQYPQYLAGQRHMGKQRLPRSLQQRWLRCTGMWTVPHRTTPLLTPVPGCPVLRCLPFLPCPALPAGGCPDG